MKTEMIGRAAERAQLESSLNRVTAGSGQFVLIEGEAGIGKTTLVRTFTSTLTHPVVTVSADEVEADLPGGVAEQLLASLESDPHRVALATRIGPVPDPIAVGAALLDAIGVFVERSPLVIVVEDVHWADTSSLNALAIALRRLERDAVMTVMTTRRDGAHRLPDGLRRLLDSDSGLHVELVGLTVPETRELVRHVADVELSAHSAERLAEHTGGNPLYVTALSQEVAADDLSIGVTDLPAPRDFGLVIADRLAQCGDAARSLIEAAAVIGEPVSLSFAMDVAGLPDALALRTADEACRRGLLETHDGRRGRIIGFSHPLIRAAVYECLSPARASTLHDTAAHLAYDERDRLRHRVGAAAADNAELAAELERFASAEAARGSFESAAKACLSASRVASARSERERLVLSAAGVLIRSNDPRSAALLGGEIATFDETPLKAYIQGILAAVTGDLDGGKARLIAGWKASDTVTDPSFAQAVASRLATACLTQAAYGEAVDWLREIAALNFVDDVDDPGSELAMVALLAGGVDIALEFVAARPDLYEPGSNGWPRGVPGLLALRAVGPAADPRGALKTASDVLGHYQQHGPPSDWLGLLDKLANAQLHLGLWDDVIATCLTLRSGASAVGLEMLGDVGGIYTALVQCRRGDADGARVTLASIDPASIAMAPALATVHAELATNEGEHGAAADFLAPLAAFAPYAPVLCEPSYIPWRQQYAVELIAAGRIGDARPEVEWLSARVADRPYPSVIGAASRCEALLAAATGDADRAVEKFAIAVDATQQSENLFEIAKTQLDRGAFLRREGKRSDAAASLESARDAFGALRAEPWMDRSDDELRLLGRNRQRRRDSAPDRLTPAEQAVARLVAEGASNREVAKRLVVSVRTVEYHLGHIYSKLGIASRSQLIHALNEASA